jgi:uncharacterized protein (DUF736 family)
LNAYSTAQNPFHQASQIDSDPVLRDPPQRRPYDFKGQPAPRDRVTPVKSVRFMAGSSQGRQSRWPEMKGKSMSYNIGFFKATNSGYEGRIETLAVKIQAEFTRVVNKTNHKAPNYEIHSGDLKIGVAWDKVSKKKGTKYVFVALEDPSFASGFYGLFRNSGVEDGYTLTFDRDKRQTQEKPAEAQAA